MFTTIKTDLCRIVTGIALQARQAAARHLACHVGGSLPGLYLHLPFTRLSLWVEWVGWWVGFGHSNSSPTDWEFFVGHVQGVLSLEHSRSPSHRSASERQ